VNARTAYPSAVRETLERELKLDVDGSFALPQLPGSPLPERVFTSTYHDTPARSLGRAGITLRRRVENGTSLWQLKLPRAGEASARIELEEPGGPSGPPAGLARLLVAHVRHGGLEPVATLRTHRSGIRVEESGHPVADVTVDEVTIVYSERGVAGFTELEVELVGEGGERDLQRLGQVLLDAGAHESSGSRSSCACSICRRRRAPPGRRRCTSTYATRSSGSWPPSRRTTPACDSAATRRIFISCAWRRGGRAR